MKWHFIHDWSQWKELDHATKAIQNNNGEWVTIAIYRVFEKQCNICKLIKIKRVKI